MATRHRTAPHTTRPPDRAHLTVGLVIFTAVGVFRTTRHPVIRSVEPGEEWRWCYVDELLG